MQEAFYILVIILLFLCFKRLLCSKRERYITEKYFVMNSPQIPPKLKYMAPELSAYKMAFS